ncbi:MAG TPA: neutral/alkaline non-lysosomal ceramidase N-terminal domain-containing protein [Limnochordia bacterium]
MKLSIGFSAVDLSDAVHRLPQAPDLSGYVARMGPSTGIHDPPYVRALALRRGEKTLLLIVADVLGIDRPMLRAIRAALAERTGIPPAAICVAATHTHSAPATIALHGCGVPLPQWRTALTDAMVSAGAEAIGRLAPGRVGFGWADGSGLSRNRRPGDGPTDPRIGIARFDDASGRPIGVAVHFACHPVVLDHENRLISADYPAALLQALEARGLFALFVNGACGDINPAERGGFEAASRMGRALADRVLSALGRIETAGEPALSFRTAEAELVYGSSRPDREALAKAAAAHRERHKALAADPAQAIPARIEAAMAEWAAAMLARIEASPTAALAAGEPIELQILGIGAWRLVPLPGEIFCATGLAIDRGLGGNAWVLGYANGNVGYVPTAESFAHGGYEVDAAHRYYDRPAAFAPGEAERLARLAVALAAEGGQE